MSNVEHLFENALLALENDYYFGEWKRIETDRHNTDGVSEEVIEAIWELAIYTKYTYEPSLNVIPIEWIKKKAQEFLMNRNFRWATDFQEVIDMWKVENNIPLFDGELKITLEKENEID